jgi:hypothetical protein
MTFFCYCSIRQGFAVLLKEISLVLAESFKLIRKALIMVLFLFRQFPAVFMYAVLGWR